MFGFLLVIHLVLAIIKLVVNLGVLLITLPLKIIAGAIFLIFIILIPLCISGGLATLLIVPVATLIPVLPIVLVILGLYIRAKR